MGTLGFDDEDKTCLLRIVAGILHFGNIEVKQRPREEWATIPTTTGTFIASMPFSLTESITHNTIIHLYATTAQS